MEEAILLDPENLTLILVAAENAIRLGPGTRPHFWLAQVPRSLRDDSRVLTVQGMVQYTEQNFKAGLATWRKGLDANPTDVGLRQRLALVLLDLGRDDEADTIIKRYRELVDNKKIRYSGSWRRSRTSTQGVSAPRSRNWRRCAGQLPESFQTHVHLILRVARRSRGTP